MTRFLFVILATLAAIVSWNVLVFIGGSEGWGKSPLAASDDPSGFFQVAQGIVEAEHTGNFSMQFLERGEVAATFDFSTGEPVDGDTVFQVASLGKWISAWGVMVLVESGAVDLDKPVSDYLKRWQLPASEFDNSGVTVRRLLSHTAGLDDGLGYDGFDSAAEVQTLEASLTRALDASPGNDGVVKLGVEPGSGWNYSGGGYTILQLLIEEVSGQSFPEFMTEQVFDPLGMNRTTFRHDEAVQFGLAQNFDLEGNAEPFRWYTALAATSLFTSSNDLAIFIAAQAEGGGQSVLSSETLTLMQTPHASQMGTDIWGLGPMLFAPNNQGGHIVGHDGNNEPAINTVARFDPDTGDGIVILSTGSDLRATQIAGEWVFWKTGNIDNLMFLLVFETMLFWMGVGSIAILLLGIVIGWTTRKRKHAS